MHATIVKGIETVSRLQHFRTFCENNTRRDITMSPAIHIMSRDVITNIISQSHGVMSRQNKNNAIS